MAPSRQGPHGRKAPRVPRRAALARAAALASTSLGGPAAWAGTGGALASTSLIGQLPQPSGASALQPETIVLPLMCMGSAFCTEYYISGRRFRAVVDTGSPFLLCDGSVTSTFERWGRFADDDAPRSVPLGDVTREGFGGQDVDVEWRRGQLRLAGYETTRQVYAALDDRIRGARAGPWTSPSRRDAFFEPINFGVVRNYEGLGGGGAIYLGLVKERLPNRIRPTFLEQTDICGMRFDFVGRTLTLARRPLLPPGADAIPLVDLRPLGAPVASYAVRVDKLSANGAEMPLRRPVVAVIDTGTTGLVIGDSLYDTAEFPLPGNAVRALDVEVLTESGKRVTLSAARRRARLDDLAAEPASARARNSREPPKPESFPLIATPVRLAWFDKLREAGEEPPHVIFLGLAFLSRLQVTIDTDEMRMFAKELTFDV